MTADPESLRRIVAEAMFECEPAYMSTSPGWKGTRWTWENIEPSSRARWLRLADAAIRALSPQPARDDVLEDFAKTLDARVEWLFDEAHKGGNWEHLKTRADEAAYCAKKARAFKSAPPSEPTTEQKERSDDLS